MVGTYYKWVKTLNEPADILGLDEKGRAQYSFNVIANKQSSPTFLEEMIRVLVNAGIGALNTTIFASSMAKLSDDPSKWFVTIRETGGAPPETVHNQTSPPMYLQPAAQVIVHAPTVVAAKAKAWAAYNALAAVKNTTITPVTP
jgi:hypothetical protein